MKNRFLPSVIAAACSLMSLVTTVNASPAEFTLTTTVFAILPEVSHGDSAVITLLADNGSASLLNQTWQASDVISVTFDFNNGAHFTVFAGPTVEQPWVSSLGTFSTDGVGALLTVPSNWSGGTTEALYTNSTQTPTAWYLSEYNDKYYTNGGAAGFDPANYSILVSSWSVSAAAVPEPSAFAALAGLSALTLVSLRRKPRADRAG